MRRERQRLTVNGSIETGSSLAFSPLLEDHPAGALPIRVLALDDQVVLSASKVLYLAGPAKCGEQIRGKQEGNRGKQVQGNRSSLNCVIFRLVLASRSGPKGDTHIFMPSPVVKMRVLIFTAALPYNSPLEQSPSTSSPRPWLLGTGLFVAIIAAIKLLLHLYAGHRYAPGCWEIGRAHV